MRHLPATTVLYVANAAKIGGGNRVLMDLITNLTPGRFAPVLVSPAEGELTDWAQSAGIPCAVSPDGDWQDSRALARRSAGLARLIVRHRAGVVHASAPTCYRALGVAARILGRVRVCHLGFPPQPGELKHAFIAAPDAVVGCYDGQATEHAQEIGTLSRHARVVGIPNGIDTGRFRPRPVDAEGETLRGGARQVIAILGHISDVKGHPVFIEAAAKIAQAFPDTRFLVIGGETVQPGLRAQLEARASALGLGDRVRFLGFRRDVERVLAAADIVVLPSQAEGFPLAVLEAMACGKTVIASGVGGVPEAIVHGVSGLLLTSSDVASVVAAVQSVIGDTALQHRLAAAARERIEARFSVGTFASAVQRLYDSCLRELPPVGPRTAARTSEQRAGRTVVHTP